MRNLKLILYLLPFLVLVACQQQTSVPLESSATYISSSLGSCFVLPRDHIWNTPVDKLPRYWRSDAYVRSIGLTNPLFAGFGPPALGGYDGKPYTVVTNAQPKVPIRFTEYGHESDPGPYPIPRNAMIEDEKVPGSDRHVSVINKDTCMLYELYNAYPQRDGSWKASSGAVFNLRSYSLRPQKWTSADAAGLAILPGLVRYEEIKAGVINHALRFSAPKTRREYVWPARHQSSSITDKNVPPMGQRFRLKASYNISGFSPEVQVVLKALKKYGMILADNSNGNWVVYGAPDDRWDRERLKDLKRLRPSDFEAVDVSSLLISPDSGRARAQ
jgi:hypothetical protein